MSTNIQKSNAPPGAMVEVDITNIDEGKLLKKINASILQGLRDLYQYERESETKGNLVIGVQLDFRRMKASDSVWLIAAKVSKKIPQHQNVSSATQRGEHLLCQPIGTNDDPTQQVFFDQRGGMIDVNGNPAFVDPDTGEMRDSIPIGSARRKQG